MLITFLYNIVSHMYFHGFCIFSMFSTETLNLRKTEGQAKLGGIVVCVSGAILMAIFRGPAVFGSKGLDAAPGEISANSHFLGLVIGSWHLGVLCLIGNCMCMAIYFAFQVRLYVVQEIVFSLVLILIKLKIQLTEDMIFDRTWLRNRTHIAN